MATYNSHTHVFTMANAPKRFLHLYMPDIAANLIDKITNTQPGSWAFQRLLALMGPAGKRYAQFLKIGKSSGQLEVFENLMSQYTDDEDLKFVALTMYMENFGAGVSTTGFEGQIHEAVQVKKRYPERLKLFFGLDPRWKSTGAELRRTIEAYFDTKIDVGSNTWLYPFAGLKIYPSTGFYVFDQKLMETFEWAAHHGVPVVSHCYYRGGIYNNDRSYLEANINPYNPYSRSEHQTGRYEYEKSFKKWLLGKQEANNNKNTCSHFLDPASFETVINYFQRQAKPLKVALAHYGGSEQILISKGLRKPSKEEAALYGARRENWYEQIKKLMLNYEGVYTDIAYTLLDPHVHTTIFEDLANPLLAGRIMYGTDYFMTEKDQAEKTTYQFFKKAATAIANEDGSNAWQRISSLNTEKFLQSSYY